MTGTERDSFQPFAVSRKGGGLTHRPLKASHTSLPPPPNPSPNPSQVGSILDLKHVVKGIITRTDGPLHRLLVVLKKSESPLARLSIFEGAPRRCPRDPFAVGPFCPFVLPFQRLAVSVSL